MLQPHSVLPNRFIGLDIRRDYFVALGVDATLQPVLGPQTVSNLDLDAWIARCLTYPQIFCVP